MQKPIKADLATLYWSGWGWRRVEAVNNKQKIIRLFVEHSKRAEKKNQRVWASSTLHRIRFRCQEENSTIIIILVSYGRGVYQLNLLVSLAGEIFRDVLATNSIR